jgi:hypothetical protein
MSLREKIKDIHAELKLLVLPAVPKLTLKEKITKESYLSLKAANKAHSLAAKSIREEAIRNKGQIRHILRYLKSKEGQVARLHHVSLCFLRGKKYSEVEKNVEKKNRISAKALQDFLFYYVNWNYHKDLTHDIAKFLGE